MLDQSMSSVSHVMSWANVQISVKTIKGGAIYVRKLAIPQTVVLRVKKRISGSVDFCAGNDPLIVKSTCVKCLGLIDSGCSRSIISSVAAKKCDIQAIATRDEVMMMNGEMFCIFGTLFVQLCFSDVAYSVPCSVTNLF